jgi:hypothetical protein
MTKPIKFEQLNLLDIILVGDWVEHLDIEGKRYVCPWHGLIGQCVAIQTSDVPVIKFRKLKDLVGCPRRYLKKILPPDDAS